MMIIPMSVDASERLVKFNSEQSDWYTTCPKCHQHLRGKLSELVEHRCGTETK